MDGNALNSKTRHLPNLVLEQRQLSPLNDIKITLFINAIEHEIMVSLYVQSSQWELAY